MVEAAKTLDSPRTSFDSKTKPKLQNFNNSDLIYLDLCSSDFTLNFTPFVSLRPEGICHYLVFPVWLQSLEWRCSLLMGYRVSESSKY